MPPATITFDGSSLCKIVSKGAQGSAKTKHASVLVDTVVVDCCFEEVVDDDDDDDASESDKADDVIVSMCAVIPRGNPPMSKEIPGESSHSRPWPITLEPRTATH